MAKKIVRKKTPVKGRPTKYSDDVVDKICQLISESSKGLHHICNKHKDLPSFSTIMRWLGEEDKKSFQDKYVRARELQADFLADEIIEIADKQRLTTVTNNTTAFGGQVSITKSDNYNRSKLQMDARKWKASKLAPKKYGDKLDVVSNGETIGSFNVGFGKPQENG